MINERRAEVFNLTNASSKAKTIAFDIEGLPGGTNPNCVRVFEVQYVDTREGKVCGSALLPVITRADGRYQTVVEAGMTRQIWLAFESRELDSGQHTGTIQLECDQWRHELQIQLNVAPIRFPDRSRLAFSGCDEIFNKGYSITEENQEAARQFILDDGLINGVWCTPGQVPIPRDEAFDDEGNLVGEVDFSGWDEFVEFWPDMPQYIAFVNFNPKRTFAGKMVGTPSFQLAMAQWAAAWAEHNRQLGLEPGQTVVLFIDEPKDEDLLAASYHCAHAFGQGTREIFTFTDPHIDSINSEWGRKNIEIHDIVSPHLPAFVTKDESTRKAYASVVDNDQQLWFYSCNGPARMYDPSYYRLQPWQAYLYGGTGSVFWAFGDASYTTSWNEYAVAEFRESFTPLYIGFEDIHTSKHYEAAREGVMDYECLRMLEDRVEALRHSPKHRAAVQRANRLLESLPASLINNVESRFGKQHYQGWRNASKLADRSRKKVLSMLVDLEQ